VVTLNWVPRRQICRRFCYYCNHGYDRRLVRGHQRDPLRGHRVNINLALPNVNVRCIETYLCEEDGKTVFDIYWTPLYAHNQWSSIRLEIESYTHGHYQYDGQSGVFLESPKSYYALRNHLYYKRLRW
jgi:hypothetical protein